MQMNDNLLRMVGDDIRNLSTAVPFQAFRVNMANGKSVEIPYPDFMLLSPNGRRLIVEKMDDTFEIIDVLLVTSAETIPRNGSRARRGKKRR